MLVYHFPDKSRLVPYQGTAATVRRSRCGLRYCDKSVKCNIACDNCVTGVL